MELNCTCNNIIICDSTQKNVYCCKCKKWWGMKDLQQVSKEIEEYEDELYYLEGSEDWSVYL